MKCQVCVDEIIKRAKPKRWRTAEDDQILIAQISPEVDALPEAITASRGGPKCLKHYLIFA
jgi:hypothetical protein